MRTPERTSSSVSLRYRHGLRFPSKLAFLHVCVLVAQACLTLCGLMGCSPPVCSVHGILQPRILE